MFEKKQACCRDPETPTICGPALEKIFSLAVLKDKQKRNRKIAEAVEKYGYTQRAIAIHLAMHFTYVSRILRKIETL